MLTLAPVARGVDCLQPHLNLAGMLWSSSQDGGKGSHDVRKSPWATVLSGRHVVGQRGPRLAMLPPNSEETQMLPGKLGGWPGGLARGGAARGCSWPAELGFPDLQEPGGLGCGRRGELSSWTLALSSFAGSFCHAEWARWRCPGLSWPCQLRRVTREGRGECQVLAEAEASSLVLGGQGLSLALPHSSLGWLWTQVLRAQD